MGIHFSEFSPLKHFIYILFLLPLIQAQPELEIQNKEHMPLHTKLLWGDNGFFRQLNFGPKTRKDELKLRVKMLQNHQKLALASLGLLAYQSSLGYQMKEGDYSLRKNHRQFSKITWGAYMTSASLSYFAPPAQKYDNRLSSMKIHRWLSYVHFAGMMAVPFLGKNIVTSDNYDEALALHQNVATITFASMSLSAILTLLPY